MCVRFRRLCFFFVLKEVYSRVYLYSSYNGFWVIECYLGFVEERLMFIIIVINGIVVIVVISFCLLEMSILWFFKYFTVFFVVYRIVSYLFIRE